MAPAKQAESAQPKRGFWSRIAPALMMMVLPPLFTEWLLGGTRLSTLIGFPPLFLMEMMVWGGGALMLRALARKLGLGWGSLILFGLAIGMAEEFIIIQTSFAPLVIKLKGVEWARAGGINYVYALWALGYTSVWVVLMPTLVVEMVFPARRSETFLSKTGLAIVAILFPIGALMAWYGWTHVARVQSFHLPLYNPSHADYAGALAVIAALFVWATRFAPRLGNDRNPPHPILLGVGGAVWATAWFGLVLLAFGIAPQLSAPTVFAGFLVLILLVLAGMIRWAASTRWTERHSFAIFFGTLTGAMLASSAGFMDALPMDIWFKAVTNLIALGLMILLGRTVMRRAS